ncbi:MAG: chromate transporter [Polynucleobacter sp.]|nr:MAG: chromate transporter [Polynucleobacter sp.]
MITMSTLDWLSLFLNMASLSLMAVGGAITLAPEMQKFLVQEKGWITDLQFNASIAIAQSSPGPNLLFVALFGWHVGINATSDVYLQTALGLMGALISLLGLLIPSTTLTFFAAQWAQKNKELKVVRAFKQGMAPIVISMLLATCWLLTSPHRDITQDWPLLLLASFIALLTLKTKLHILWMLALGALLGAFGLV